MDDQSMLPPEKRSRGALTDEQFEFICSCLAKFERPLEIQQKFVERFQRQLPSMAKTVYRIAASHKWKTKIQRLREEYVNRLMDVPIANRRIRLDLLQEELDRIHTQHKRFGKGSQFEYSRTLASLLREAREEMEALNPEIRNVIINQIQLMKPEELEQRRVELLRKLSLLGDKHDA